MAALGAPGVIPGPPPRLAPSKRAVDSGPGISQGSRKRKEQFQARSGPPPRVPRVAPAENAPGLLARWGVLPEQYLRLRAKQVLLAAWDNRLVFTSLLLLVTARKLITP